MIRLKDVVVKFYLQHKRVIVKAAVAVLSSRLVIKGLMQIPGIEQNKKEIAEIETKIAQEKETQNEIDNLEEKVNSDEYIERIASEKLGLVKSNATIFYDISDED